MSIVGAWHSVWLPSALQTLKLLNLIATAIKSLALNATTITTYIN